MEYEKCIKELLDAVSTLLKSNNSLVERVSDLSGQLPQALDKIVTLEEENARLSGVLAGRIFFFSFSNLL